MTRTDLLTQHGIYPSYWPEDQAPVLTLPNGITITEEQALAIERDMRLVADWNALLEFGELPPAGSINEPVYDPYAIEWNGPRPALDPYDARQSFARLTALRELVSERDMMLEGIEEQRALAQIPGQSLEAQLVARGIDPMLIAGATPDELLQLGVEPELLANATPDELRELGINAPQNDDGGGRNMIANVAGGFGAARYLNITGRLPEVSGVVARTPVVEVVDSNTRLPPSRGMLVRGEDGVFRPANNAVRATEQGASEALVVRNSIVRSAETGAAETAAAATRGAGSTIARGIGRAAIPVALAIDAVDLGSSIASDVERGDGSPVETVHSAGRIAGGWGGAFIGAKAGAAIGAFTGPFAWIGVPAGAILGGITGAIVGSYAGESVADAVVGESPSEQAVTS
jgi:hypothetical protein